MSRLALLAAVLVGSTTVAQDDPLASLGLGPITSRVQRGTALYLALGRGGLAIVDLGDAARPKLVGRLLEGRVVSQLLVEGDQLVALEVREEAVRLSVADPLHPVAWGLAAAPVQTAAVPLSPAVEAPMPPTAPRTVLHAKVVEVTNGRIIFSAGLAEGVAKSARVKVISQRLVSKPDLAGRGTVEMPSGEVTAVLAVEQADEHRAMAVLGRGDIAAPGDLVEPTTEALSERLALPRRAPYAWRVGFVVRPFLGIESGSKPVGVLTDAFVAYTFSSIPLTLAAMIEPLGFALNAVEAHYPVTLGVTASYTTDYFEVGLGAGALIGNQGPCNQIGPDGVRTSGCEMNNGYTINQRLRLGAVDGLHLEWHSSVFSRPDRFVFGVGRGEIAVPLTSRLSLFGDGGGGENGWAFGELGVRTYVLGAGAPGTVILSASLGYAAIFDGPGREYVRGPSVAFGAEWRL